MAQYDLVVLNTATPALQVPQVGDSYRLARNLNGNNMDITGVGTLAATNISGTNITATLFTGPMVFTPGANGITADRVQLAVEQAAGFGLAAATAIIGHVGNATNSHAATSITFAPLGSGLTSDTAGEALIELKGLIDSIEVGGGLADAPSNGTLYGRLNGAWVAVVGDGSYTVFTADINNPGLVPSSGTPTGRVLTDGGWDDMPGVYDVYDGVAAGLVPAASATGAAAAPGTQFLAKDGLWRVPA